MSYLDYLRDTATDLIQDSNDLELLDLIIKLLLNESPQ